MGPQQLRVNPLPAPAQQPVAPAQQAAAPPQQPAGNSQTHPGFNLYAHIQTREYL